MFSEKSDYLKGESFFVGKILCTKTGALKGEPVFVGNIFPFLLESIFRCSGRQLDAGLCMVMDVAVYRSIWCRLVYGVPVQGVHIRMCKGTGCLFRNAKNNVQF